MRRGAALAAVFVHVALATAGASAQTARVEEWSTNVATGVRSAWLSNGIRIHHKQVGDTDAKVVITIRLVGGALQETATNRGITQAAASAWAKPQSREMPPDEFAAHLAASSIGYEGGIIDADLVGMTLSCPAKSLDIAFEAAFMLIGDAWIDEETFESWRAEQHALIEARRRESDGVLRDLVGASLFPPGDVRVRPLEQDDVDRLELPAARAWLTALGTEAPIEIGIAGPVGAGIVFESAASALGSLADRERISPDTLGDLRHLGPRPVGPILAEHACPECPTSAAMIGFYAPDRRDIVQTQRALAAMIFLRERFKRLNWGFDPEPDVGVVMLTGRAFPGYGVFHVLATCGPHDVGEVVQRVRDAIDSFGATGPTTYEMEQFRVGARADLTEAMSDPWFWSSRLALLSSIGTDLDLFAQLIESYESIDAEDIRRTFAEFSAPTNRFELVVRAGKGRGR